MRVGIANQETWGFINGIYDRLAEHYELSSFQQRSFKLPIFNTRFNRLLSRHDLKKFLRANDLVFFEWASQLLVTASSFPKQSPIIVRLHRYEMYQWVDLINWNAVNKIILVSEAKRREFETKFPEHASKIVVINEAVDPIKFKFNNKKFNGDIGILCHLTPRKRVYDLILSFYELSKLEGDFHLHIAGGPHVSFGDYFEAIVHIVKELQIEDKVTFYGNVEDTWNWYPLIDIFISNSYSEGLQVAPMEAMASGCYCFSHHWNGASELLPKENLFYGSSDLIEKIISYSNFSEADKQIQRVNMRAIAREKFDIEHITRQIRRVIDEAMAGSG